MARANVLLFWLLLGATPVFAEVRYVNLANPSPAPPYTSWSNAATNIQDAIDAANAGDEIVVTNGVYASGGRTVNGSSLTNRVAVTKAVVLRSVNGPDVTVIQGYQVPVTVFGNEAIRCVYLGEGAAMAGFTLTNGAAGDGGGAWAAGNTTISNCVFVGNSAGSFGGGVFGSYGAVVTKCLFRGNDSTFLGGGASGCILDRCVFEENSALGGGGVDGCMADGCILSGNTATGAGGGASGSRLNNCVVSGNSAWGGGGAFGGWLTNCTITRNTAIAGGGVSAPSPVDGGEGGTGFVWLWNCIVYDNRSANEAPNNYAWAIFHYSCTTPLPEGPGNVDTDPGFVAPAAGDYHLSACSPCIDAGDNQSITGDFDISGRPRIVGGTVDMGAYEFDPHHLPNIGPLAIALKEFGADDRLRVSFGPSSRAAYYILYRGTSLTRIDTPVTTQLVTDCDAELIDPNPTVGQGMAFYRVREVPFSQPLDSDGDGIDDVYELRHVRFLNPLNRADAGQDFDHDGRSNLQEYLAGSNPARPLGRALAANDRGWFALKTNGSLWFFDTDQGQLQRIGGNTNFVSICAGGFPIAAEDEWVAGSASYWSGGPNGPHTLALKTDGSLWAWGDNSSGQLGIGTDEFNSLNRVGIDSDWKTVAAGTGFSTGLKMDGTLWAWGDNGGGQLGNGDFVGTSTPIQIGTDHDWAAIENSKYDYFNGYTLALKTNGSLWMWGCTCTVPPDDPRYTFLSVPTRIGTDSDWSSVAAGDTHIVAIKTEGSLWTWGSSTGGNVPTRLGAETNWVSIAAGVNVSVALKRDGTFWSWTVGESPHQGGTDIDWGSPP